MISNNNTPQIEAILNICNGTLTKYIPAPSCRSIQADLLIDLRQFKTSVGWKEFWVKNRDVVMEESSSEEEYQYFDKEGLGTQVSPKSKGAHISSYELDHF